MAKDNFPFDDNGDSDSDSDWDDNSRSEYDNSKAEELRQNIIEIHKKLTGENAEPVTNHELLQFLQVLNYNFVSLTKLLQAILIKTTEMDRAVTMVAAGTLRLNNSLQQFFETNSMLDEIGEGNFNVSGSTSDEKFIF